MPTVPISTTPQTSVAGPSSAPPSDTDQAIAAALLHREGHFDQPDDAIAKPLAKVLPMRKRSRA